MSTIGPTDRPEVFEWNENQPESASQPADDPERLRITHVGAWARGSRGSGTCPIACASGTPRPARYSDRRAYTTCPPPRVGTGNLSNVERALAEPVELDEGVDFYVGLAWSPNGALQTGWHIDYGSLPAHRDRSTSSIPANMAASNSDPHTADLDRGLCRGLRTDRGSLGPARRLRRAGRQCVRVPRRDHGRRRNWSARSGAGTGRTRTRLATMPVPNVTAGEVAPESWGDAVADSVNALEAQMLALRVVPTGADLPFGGTTAPTGFLLCEGGTASRSTYAALFAVLGTAYGVGDGSTTFGLPYLRGRFPLGKPASGTGSGSGLDGRGDRPYAHRRGAYAHRP